MTITQLETHGATSQNHPFSNAWRKSRGGKRERKCRSYPRFLQDSVNMILLVCRLTKSDAKENRMLSCLLEPNLKPLRRFRADRPLNSKTSNDLSRNFFRQKKHGRKYVPCQKAMRQRTAQRLGQTIATAAAWLMPWPPASGPQLLPLVRASCSLNQSPSIVDTSTIPRTNTNGHRVH